MSVLSTCTLTDLTAFLARLQATGRPRPAKVCAANRNERERSQ